MGELLLTQAPRPNQQDLHVHWDAAALWGSGWLYHSPGDRRQHGDNSEVQGGVDQEMPPIPVPEVRGQCPHRAGQQSLLCVPWRPESACAAQQRAELEFGEQVARGDCVRQGIRALQGLCSGDRQPAPLCSAPRGERGEHPAGMLQGQDGELGASQSHSRACSTNRRFSSGSQACAALS